jgi:hypothetical protein
MLTHRYGKLKATLWKTDSAMAHIARKSAWSGVTSSTLVN